MAEHDRLDQLLGDRRAVDAGERPVRVGLNRPGHHLLARASLTNDQHRDLRAAHPLGHGVDLLHLRAADHGVHGPGEGAAGGGREDHGLARGGLLGRGARPLDQPGAGGGGVGEERGAADEGGCALLPRDGHHRRQVLQRLGGHLGQQHLHGGWTVEPQAVHRPQVSLDQREPAVQSGAGLARLGRSHQQQAELAAERAVPGQLVLQQRQEAVVPHQALDPPLHR